MQPRRLSVYALTCFGTLVGIIWYCLGLNVHSIQYPCISSTLSPVSKRLENSLVNVSANNAIRYDNNEKRIVMIYALQDEQDWTNPILNYTYPPWYTYSLPVI